MDAELDRQFRAMGVTIMPDAATPAKEAFEVMPDNWTSVIAFLACETQWRLLAGARALVWLGLDYAAVDTVLRHLAPDDPASVFADIQVMEGAALDVFARARA